jgi:LDH2 family malate/lactate/ureidoglycolate dehydrogenase
MVILLKSAGLTAEHCRQAADNLLQADLRGVNTHGVMRLHLYLNRLHTGAVKARPNLRVLEERKATALLDGDNGLGQISGLRAMTIAIEKAAVCGIGTVSVVNGQHFGAGAYYAWLAGQKDMIGIAATNTPPLMAPWGGRKAMIGNNPLAVFVPAGEEYPILLDMAFSQVAQGKISLALTKGEKIPRGWALDREGTPTDDPAAALNGLLLAAGGYKGYGQAVVLDMLAGLLGGAGAGRNVFSMADCPDKPQNSGQLYMAIDISAYRDPAAFKKDVDAYIRAVKASPRAKGTEEIFLPGEQSWRRMEQNKKQGILLPQGLFDDLARAGDAFGMDIRPLIPAEEDGGLAQGKAD